MKGRNHKIFTFLLTAIFMQSFVFGQVPNMRAYASETTIGTTIKVTDSSNQAITSYTNSGGKTINNILNPAIKLSADAKAQIAYGFNNATFSKYKFVQATNLTTVPSFPEDTAMTDIPLPPPNSYEAYKDDIGKQNYLTTKHYEYAGKAGTASARNVSFGTPSFEGVFEQEAVTDSTKNPVKYDLGSTNGSNFYVSQKNSDTTSYGSPVSKSSSNTITYNGQYYPKTKYASWKAMKMWGYFVPKQTGTYILGSWSDDGAYGYIIKDGVQQVFVNDWQLKAPFDRTENTSMQLTAGKYYPIYMEWYEGCPTQAAFVPEYKFGVSDSKASKASFIPIPENELYSSKTTTPGDIAGAYFGDVSGISFPAQDGIYYIATKFKSNEGTTQGLYGPFIIDNTKPTLSNLVVTSNNSNESKWAVAGNTLTTKFTASENLSGNPQILINGYVTNATISKDAQNNYTATVKIANDGSINTSSDKVIDGPIKVQVAHYADLYGNEGVAVQDSTVTYDNTAPTVGITYSANPIGQGTEIITATYSEPVNSKETPQITITNQQNSTKLIQSQSMILVGTDRKTWSYSYTIDGIYNNVTAGVSLSTTHDAAGNQAVATTSAFNIDTIKPTITLSFSSDPVSIGTEVITATCSKAVNGTPKIAIDQPGSLDITGISMTLIGNSTWEYKYTVHADDNSNYKDGKAVVTLDLTSVKDSVGNQALPPQSNSFTIDTKSPTVVITYSGNPVKAGVETVTATYSEPIKVGETPLTSIDQQGSVDILSQSMNLVGTDRTTWTYDYTVNNDNGGTYKDGIATVTLPAVVHDLAGNIVAPTGSTFTIDTTAPMAIISTPSVAFTKNAPITYIVTYSGADKVTLNSSNITLVKTGTADGTVTASGTGNVRIVTVNTITGDGTLGIRVAAGTASDNAGNIALAPIDSATFGVWNSPPIITSTQSPINLTNTDVTITVAANAVGSGNQVVETKWLVGVKTVTDFIGTVDTVINGSTFLALSNGDYTIYAKDRVGNESVNTINISNIDRIAPSAPVITAPTSGITNNNKPTITGTGEEGAVVIVYDGSNPVGTTTVKGDGTWSLTIITGLADGIHAITATQTDVAGNVSVKSNIVILTVDTIAPPISIVDPIMVDNKINSAEQNNVTISGTTEANTVVKVIITDATGKTVEKTVTSDATGNYTVSGIDVSGLAEGKLTVKATATDAAGNTSTVTKEIVKNTRMEITITDPIMEDNIINDAEKTKVIISGTTEPNIGVKIVIKDASENKVENIVMSDATGNYTVSGIDIIKLAEGKLVVIATTTDEAGNTSIANREVAKDTIAPINPTLSPDIKTLTKENVKVTIKYPDDANIKEYRVGTSGEWLSYTKLLVIDTNCTIYARCKDLAGNISKEGSLEIRNIDKATIKTGLFINNKFSEKAGSISIVKGFSADLAFEIKDFKNQEITLEMEQTNFITISEVKVYSITDLRTPIKTLNVTGNIFTIKDLPIDKTDYILVFKATARNLGVNINDSIKINGFERSEKHIINILKLPSLQ